MIVQSTDPSNIPPSANRCQAGLNYAVNLTDREKYLDTRFIIRMTCIRICTCTYSLASLRATLSGLHLHPLRSISQGIFLDRLFLARQIKQRLVFLIHNRKVRFTGIIPQRIPKQIQLLLANRRTCHFLPVVSRIRYRWDRCTKVVSADRVAGFSYPDLCAWFGLSDDSADVVDRFPEYRFGSRDFGVLEVRVAVGANEVGCFNYLF